MKITIWQNEKNTFDKIAAEARENGELSSYSTGYMSKSGSLRKNERYHQKAKVYEFKNSHGKPILFMENDSVAEFNYEEDSNQFSIVYDKRTGEYAYYLHSGPIGHNLLAIVSPQSAEFPVYSTNADPYESLSKFEQIGELPAGEQESTVRETIEKTLLAHPEFKKEAHEILAGFDQILSVDKERQIKPLTPIEIENAKLKDKVRTMGEEITYSRRVAEKQAKRIEELNGKVERLQKENSELTEKKEGLEERNQEKDIQIKKLQTMLGKTLEFATKVRDSVVGKIFFKKPIQDLDLDGQTLPEGEEK